MRRLLALLGSLRLRMALLLLAGMGAAAVLGGWVVWRATAEAALAARASGAPGTPSPVLIWRHVPDYAVLLLLVSVGVALLAVRHVSRPLAQLAAAADSFAVSLDPRPIEVAGPTEIRPVLQAFDLMQRRVSEGVRERMHMLSAVNHDLRTPLARLTLRMERIADAELRAKLRADVLLLDRMVAQGMELARGVSLHEPPATIDLPALLQTLADEAQECGADVACDPTCAGTVRAHPELLHRCLTNLVDNAVRYGGGAVLASEVLADGTRITVSDRGPGLPDAQLEAAFEPFTRLGRSGRQVDGSGLGLTIARQQARSLGGDVSLANRSEGGLTATVTLPNRA